MVWGRCRKLRRHHEWCVMTRSTDPHCIITFTDLNLGKIRFFHKFDQFLDLSDVHDVLLLPLVTLLAMGPFLRGGLYQPPM